MGEINLDKPRPGSTTPSRYAPLPPYRLTNLGDGVQAEHNGEGMIQLKGSNGSDIIHVSAAALYAFMLGAKLHEAPGASLPVHDCSDPECEARQERFRLELTRLCRSKR